MPNSEVWKQTLLDPSWLLLAILLSIFIALCFLQRFHKIICFLRISCDSMGFRVGDLETDCDDPARQGTCARSQLASISSILIAFFCFLPIS